MARYAIKHKPTGKFLYEDEVSTFLVPEDECFMIFNKKRDADEIYDSIVDYSDDGIIFTEDGKFPVDEFEVSKL